VQKKVADIFFQALKFQKAAYLLNRNLEDDNWALLVPYITNISFTIELYLKALLTSEGKKGKVIEIHKLKELFGLLSEISQKRINYLFSQQINNSKSPAFNDDNSLEAVLEDISNAFVKSRYFYESNLGGVRFLNEVLVSVQLTLLEKEPDLQKYIKAD
tara:strand:- start:259 stop:735 length:477 start_codon:yes stop_codon:yes gene_type:complete